LRKCNRVIVGGIQLTRVPVTPPTAFCLAVVLPGSVLAQQKQQVSFRVPGENSKYIVSQNVDGGDAPNPILRLSDVRHAVPNNTASINELKLVEVIARGVGDLTDGHGTATPRTPAAR
jgi:hypothetical protein